MALSAPPGPAGEIDDGVIEEARRRQRRRETGIASVLSVAAIIAGFVLIASGGAGRRFALGPTAFRFGPPKLTYVHGLPYINGQLFPLVARPSLGAGFAALNVEDYEFGGGNSYPERGALLFGNDGYQQGPIHVNHGPAGEIEYFLAEPQVAAVRVSGVGTFRPVALPGLPPRVRAVAFYRPEEASGKVTVIDKAGRRIAVTFPPPGSRPAPSRYWQGGATAPADGACSVRSSDSGARVQWGEIATSVSSLPSAVGPAFFSCLDAWYTVAHGAFQVAVLLDAQHPGARPAPLWGAEPVPGHPNVIETPPVTYRPRAKIRPAGTAKLIRRLGKARAERLINQIDAHPEIIVTLASFLVARRESDAWVVVSGGSRASATAFLDTLDITRINQPHTS